jgi:hypothetical protein
MGNTEKRMTQMNERSQLLNALELLLQHEKFENVATALAFMLKSGTMLSELTFFIRFYLENNTQIDGDLFACSELDMELFGTDVQAETFHEAKLKAWKLMMSSKLGEYTCCGHFAGVFTNHVYFESSEQAKQSIVSSSTLNGVSTLLRLLEENPTSSYIIRSEWSSYDIAEISSFGKSAFDFHAYLIDIPALKKGETKRKGYLVQSLVRNYDCSVRELSNEQLEHHLSVLEQFGEKSAFSQRQHEVFSDYFYNVPVTLGEQCTYPTLEPVVKAELRKDQEIISTLDVFTVMEYDQDKCLKRLGKITSDCFSKQNLETIVPYADGTKKWSQVLDVIKKASFGTARKPRTATSKMVKIEECL